MAINAAGTFSISVNCLISSLILTGTQQKVPHQKIDKDEKEGILLLQHGTSVQIRDGQNLNQEGRYLSKIMVCFAWFGVRVLRGASVCEKNKKNPVLQTRRLRLFQGLYTYAQLFGFFFQTVHHVLFCFSPFVLFCLSIGLSYPQSFNVDSFL